MTGPDLAPLLAASLELLRGGYPLPAPMVPLPACRDENERRQTMADWRGMFDRDYIGAWDLGGRDVTVVIDRVKAGELVGQGGRKARKPIVYFRGKEKGLALNKTNAKAVAAMYGNDTSKWAGKAITLYPTQTQFGGDTVDCIRVRPERPKTEKKDEAAE